MLRNGWHCLHLYAEDGSFSLKNGTPVVSGQITAAADGSALTVYDFSITKSVFGMLLILAAMVWMFLSIAGYYKKNKDQAPKVWYPRAIDYFFVRDEIARPSIGARADKFMPFLLTVFFFIFFCNLLGLVPFLGGFNITGTIGVTIRIGLFGVRVDNHQWKQALLDSSSGLLGCQIP